MYNKWFDWFVMYFHDRLYRYDMVMYMFRIGVARFFAANLLFGLANITT